MRRHLHSILPVLLLVTGCTMLPNDEFGRRQVYERRLNRLTFPTTRERIYKSLPPASHPQRTSSIAGSILSGREFYQLDDALVVEMSVVYKAVSGAEDLLNPSPGIRGQVRAILDASQSIDNMMNWGTPEHPADIIQQAQIVRRPAR